MIPHLATIIIDDLLVLLSSAVLEPELILSGASTLNPETVTTTATARESATTRTQTPQESAGADGGGKIPPCMLHPDDPANFLKLSEALRILTQHFLDDADVSRADVLLREYCTELITVSTL